MSSLKTSAWEATVCWDLEILLPWQPDVTTSLYTLGLALYEPALFTMPRTKPLSRGTALLRYNNPQNHLMGDPIWVSYPRNILGGARAIGVVSKTFAFTFLKRVFLVTHVKTHNCLHDLSPMMHTQARFKHIDLFYLSFATLMIVSILWPLKNPFKMGFLNRRVFL